MVIVVVVIVVVVVGGRGRGVSVPEEVDVAGAEDHVGGRVAAGQPRRHLVEHFVVLVVVVVVN